MSSGGIVTLLNGRAANWDGTQAQAAAVAVCHKPIAWLRNWRNVFSGNQMALDVEGVVEGGVGRDKPLR